MINDINDTIKNEDNNMEEVIDAKIVKIIQVDSCIFCPFSHYGGNDDSEDTNYYCRHSNPNKLIPREIYFNHIFLDTCELPSAICVETEEVDALE